MKRCYILIGLFIIFIIIFTVIGSFIVSGNIAIEIEKDILMVQKNKEVYFNVYGYSIDNPNIIINPYGNSPLTALIMFETDDYSEVEIIIKSKDGNSDIKYKFGKDKYHMIPVYGLYADFDNTVIIKSDGIENSVNIKTDKLPEDFIYISDATNDNFVFYNSNYPYAVDVNGEVRWYLNSNYYGNITYIGNSSIIIGSDKYTEDGRTISIYKMSLLGKIYNEYVFDGDYYGYNVLYDENVIVLSDKILKVDLQTGDIIYDYGVNDNYDYLGIYEDSIIVRKDNNFYKINGGEIEEIQYYIDNNVHFFYENTSNYQIVISNKFGQLNETDVSKRNVNLFSYDILNELVDITITQDLDRIKIVNNTENNIYVILDKFLDKRVYEVSDIKYINLVGLSGKYTIYLKIDDTLYKTDYFIEV